MLGQLVLVTTILVSAADAQPASAPDRSFRVIVNASNPVSAPTRAELSAIFMKRVRRWPDRTEVIPVDQSPTSPVRESFSRSIHGKGVPYVIRYWHRLIFAGRAIPPDEAASDDAVIEFVKRNRGAVGYIDSRTPIPDGIRVITVKK